MGDSLKYIVYITINKVNSKIYVGVHKTKYPYKFDGYLGCGAKVQDKHSYRFGKYPIHHAINKYGPDNFIRKTLAVFDTEQEALDLEAMLVNQEFISRADTYNAALGGGIPQAPSKIIYQYDLQGNYLKEWESITEASLFYKCSSTSIGRAVLDRTPSVGFLWSEFKLDKLHLEDFKIDANKIPCFLYDLNGNYLREFKSLTECAQYLNVTIDKVSRAVLGKYSINKEYYVSSIKYDTFQFYINNHQDCPIYQYDLEGNFVKEYSNISEVNKAFGKFVPVSTSIRTGQTTLGYQWSYEKVPNMKRYKGKTTRRKIGQYDLNGNLLKVFDSVRAARKECSGCINVLSGRQASSCGYIWKYMEN